MFEELVSNVIRYGFDDADGHQVGVTVAIGADRLSITIKDDGRPFNPLEAPAPDQPDSLADASIGGLGIMLVREAAIGMTYDRQGGHNSTTVHLSLT